MRKIINPYGEPYTWFYTNYEYTAKKHTICFQWLRYQGSEFHLSFDLIGDRDAAFYLLKEKYAPKYKLKVTDACTRWASVNLSVDVTKTLTPRMFRELLKEYEYLVTYTQRFTLCFYTLKPGESTELFKSIKHMEDFADKLQKGLI